ncbi:hypothetical protein ACIGCK_04810 [Microbacterium sp. NPDC078428]|uniref:phage major capsid protein n=1 Tax=Microbacterium sp. NPDC078428 TaxID=3364190 RepID=UPI0037C610EB
MGYTYPSPAATTDGENIDVHHLLRTPTVLSRRLRDLLDRRYIADALLTGRFTAAGGVILYESGETSESDTDPEAIQPGAGYPITGLTAGEIQAAKTTKWGQDAIVSDEAISRLNMDPVNRGFTKLVNRSVKFVDSAALGVIASKVTATFSATGSGHGGAWTAGENIVQGALMAKQQVIDLEEGFEPDTIVLTGTQWAKAMALFVKAGILPREGANPVVGGVWPNVLGLNWLTSPHVPATDPIVLDSEQLGGMADENIGGPGYSRVNGVGVETKAIRDDDNDRWKLRARRVTVPVVREPSAAVKITDTGI